MNTAFVRCSMCGHQFDPQDHSSCQSCPLQKGCQLVCCPNCGFEMVNVQSSLIARFFARLLPAHNSTNITNCQTLAAIAPGSQAKVTGFSDSIPADRKAHLQAYGLIPGRSVQVIQHAPVIIIRVEHTELALESVLADMVQVENIHSG